MRTGLSKKVGEISILVLGEVFTAALSLPSYFIQGIAIYIIIMELMSIFENLDKMGVPVPKGVKKAINNTADTVNNGDIQDIDNLAQRMAKSNDRSEE
jgi:phage-related holin